MTRNTWRDAAAEASLTTPEFWQAVLCKRVNDTKPLEIAADDGRDNDSTRLLQDIPSYEQMDEPTEQLRLLLEEHSRSNPPWKKHEQFLDSKWVAVLSQCEERLDRMIRSNAPASGTSCLKAARKRVMQSRIALAGSIPAETMESINDKFVNLPDTNEMLLKGTAKGRHRPDNGTVWDTTAGLYITLFFGAICVPLGLLSVVHMTMGKSTIFTFNFWEVLLGSDGDSSGDF
jgi:hypothetical protein